MSHTYCCALYHCVFSTKERRQTIYPEIQSRLWAYMGGIAREHGMKALAIGGTNDHVHMLLSLPTSLPIAKAMREIKSAASRWMNENDLAHHFEWQEGYAAFSVGIAQTDQTVEYILHQKEHHARRGFGEELAHILAKHRMS